MKISLFLIMAVAAELASSQDSYSYVGGKCKRIKPSTWVSMIIFTHWPLHFFLEPLASKVFKTKSAKAKAAKTKAAKETFSLSN